jgi:hypothetical protein
MDFRQEALVHLYRATICGVVALLSIGSTSARAGMVFQDNFNRVGALNGSTPSFSAGSNWTAHPMFATDGTKVNAVATSLFDFTGAAYVPLPVAITSGNIYTLSATVYPGNSTDNRAVMMFGFFDAAPSWNSSSNPVDEGHAIALGVRKNGTVNTVLHGAVNAADIGVADGTNGTTFGVRLYETAPNVWSAVALELSPTNQLILGSLSPMPIPLERLANIHSIGMISGSLLPPYIDNFTLDVSPAAPSPVPEPSSFVLAGMAGLGLITLRKKVTHGQATRTP